MDVNPVQDLTSPTGPEVEQLYTNYNIQKPFIKKIQNINTNNDISETPRVGGDELLVSKDSAV